MSRRKTVHVGARLPAKLVERIDARVQAWRAALPGVRVTRTDLLQMLLEEGLRSPKMDAPRRIGGESTDP